MSANMDDHLGGEPYPHQGTETPPAAYGGYQRQLAGSWTAPQQMAHVPAECWGGSSFTDFRDHMDRMTRTMAIGGYLMPGTTNTVHYNGSSDMYPAGGGAGGSVAVHVEGQAAPVGYARAGDGGDTSFGWITAKGGLRRCQHRNREPVTLLIGGDHVADICTDCLDALPPAEPA
jgi:hypothetical protein